MFAATRQKGKHIGVFGLARSGLACVDALLRGGAEVYAWDDSEPSRQKAKEMGLPIADLHALDFAKLDSLVISPGVPLTHPEPHWSVLKAQSVGVEVIGDTEIFAREIEGTGARMIAITGTNGKSTTTALIGHILQNAGLDAHVGGNIGKAVFLLPPPEASRLYVLELSSFQIDLMPGLKPDVGILMNLTPDHLDRHGSMAHYAGVKARMFAKQTADDWAIVGVDDPWGVEIAENIRGAKVIPMSVREFMPNGVSAVAAKLCFGEDVIDLSQMSSLRGAHNWQNACAAFVAGKAMGLEAQQIEAGMKSFPGLAHRMEEVGRLGEIAFVNDSKATNADAASMALASFAHIRWIVGGLAKQGGIDGLAPFFPKLRKAYLIGAAAENFAKVLEGHAEFEHCGNIDQAVARAAQEVKPDEVVLFSPAAASFDQFPNFEVRGEAFRQAVAKLPGIRMKGA